MTKLIRASERDVACLARRRLDISPECQAQPASYCDVVVRKPWGHEFLIFENEQVAAWLLHIERGHATSMHCHPNKKTSLIVLSGLALCNTFHNRNYLSGLDAVVIDKGVFHSTQAVSDGGVDLIEIETPPNKTDLVRLDDLYGREGLGYEGLGDMVSELDKFRYFRFTGPPKADYEVYVRGSVEISLFSCNRDGTLDGRIRPCRGEFYCLFRGQARDESGEVVLDVGDSSEGTYLGAYGGVHLVHPAIALKVRTADG